MLLVVLEELELLWRVAVLFERDLEAVRRLREGRYLYVLALVYGAGEIKVISLALLLPGRA